MIIEKITVEEFFVRNPPEERCVKINGVKVADCGMEINCDLCNADVGDDGFVYLGKIRNSVHGAYCQDCAGRLEKGKTP